MPSATGCSRWAWPAGCWLWTFALFFPPMLLLGTVSPQVIRLAVPDVAHAGRVAGRVYAWSTAGAIVGTFATGYVLVSTVGMYRTVLLAAALPAVAAFLVSRVWARPALLYPASLVARRGGGRVRLLHSAANTGIARETNYYTIRVEDDDDEPGVKVLILDYLIHSRVKVNDPPVPALRTRADATGTPARGGRRPPGRAAGAGDRRRRVHLPALRPHAGADRDGWTWSRSTPA